jgi:hypothetical protein
MNQLEYSLRVEQIAQTMVTEIPKLSSHRQPVARQLLRDVRHQNLTTEAGSEQARKAVEGRGQVIAGRIRRRLSCVDCHAYPDRFKLPPIFSQESTLSVKGGGQRVGSGGESSLDRITDHFVEHAVMRLDCLSEQGNMSSNGGGHSGAITLPERGAAFDIGEEKSDGAARQLGHGAPFRPNGLVHIQGTFLLGASNYCRTSENDRGVVGESGMVLATRSQGQGRS